MRKWIVAAAGLGMVMGPIAVAPPAHAFSCWRHIYNNSSCGWSFQDVGGGAGNAYFIDPGGCTSNCTEKNGPCTVNPGCTIELQYTYSGGISNGQMNVMVNTSGQKWVGFSFQGTGVNECPYINHSVAPQTGGISLNQPANGDLTADSCNPPWNGPPQ